MSRHGHYFLSLRRRTPRGHHRSTALWRPSLPRRSLAIWQPHRSNPQGLLCSASGGSIPVRPHHLQTIDSKRSELRSQIVNRSSRCGSLSAGAFATESWELARNAPCAPGSVNARHVGVRRTTPQSTQHPPPTRTMRAPCPRARRVEQARSPRAVGRSVAAIAEVEQLCRRLHE